MGRKKQRARRDETVRQSGVIPILYDWPDVHAVIITPRDGSGRWIVPKGNIPSTLTPAEAARREAFEEAGIEGRVLPEPIGDYRYEKRGVTHEVSLFVLRVHRLHAEWPEMRQRRRGIVRLARARRLIQSEPLRRMLDRVGAAERWTPR